MRICLQQVRLELIDDQFLVVGIVGLPDRFNDFQLIGFTYRITPKAIDEFPVSRIEKVFRMKNFMGHDALLRFHILNRKADDINTISFCRYVRSTEEFFLKRRFEAIRSQIGISFMR